MTNPLFEKATSLVDRIREECEALASAIGDHEENAGVDQHNIEALEDVLDTVRALNGADQH